jgi:ribosomal protein S6
LAYRIKRYDRGKYFYFEYKSTGEGEQELRKFLETHDDVLRYLIVKKEKIETKGHLWRQKMKEALS